jgi:uridylate kinase
MTNLKYKRVLLKLSGEALMGDLDYGIDPNILSSTADAIVELKGSGLEMGIVIGAGNIFRGAGLQQSGIDRVTGDYMGMLATVMNCLALQDNLLKKGVDVVVMSSISMDIITESYNPLKAREHLSKGKVVIFAGGSGSPFFTTDSAGALRAIETKCDCMIKATNVDGVYDKDPAKFDDAVKYGNITYDEVIQKDLKVMDLTAIVLCRDHKMPLKVLNMGVKGNMQKVVQGEEIGTTVN